MRRLTFVALASFLASASPTYANDHGRIVVDEENDTYGSSDDRHFTQGIQVLYVSGDLAPESDWNRPFGWASDLLPIFDGNGKRKYATGIGQSIFTPENIRLGDPDPSDHPYAGWLYGGTHLLQDHDGRGLENLELLVGIVGPTALGKQTQNDFHDFIKVGTAHGWSHQLRDELGVVLGYDRKWRFEQPLMEGLAVDAVPEAGVSLGNVFTYASTGGMIRLGRNLGADYGPTHIRPGLSGGGWFDADRMGDGPFGWYLFIGAQGRAIARNIFLDGNSFRDSRSVAKKPLVGDLVWGASVFWSDAARLDFSVTTRSKEFYGQHFKDRTGTIGVSFRFW